MVIFNPWTLDAVGAKEPLCPTPNLFPGLGTLIFHNTSLLYLSQVKCSHSEQVCEDQEIEH